jgi:hypothetical protein
VPRLSSKSSGRLRALPWAGLLRAGVVVGKRVGTLSKKERARLGQLLRDSKGWPGNLQEKERRELRKLIAKLDVRGLGRDLMPLVRGGRRRRRR